MSFDISHNLLYSYSRFVFIVQFSMCKRPFGLGGPSLESLSAFTDYTFGSIVPCLSLSPCPLGLGGLKWTRTTDLTIISRVL